MTDLLKADLLKHAQETINTFEGKGLTVIVFFKSTCPACGARPMFNEPNVIFDWMECCECGHTFEFEKGGYLLETIVR